MIYAGDYGCFGAVNAQSPECRAARDGTRGVGPPLRDGCAARLRGRSGVSPESRGVPFPWSPRLNFGKLSLGGTPTALLRATPSVRPLSLHLKPALSCPGAGPRLILPAQLQTITLHKGF